MQVFFSKNIVDGKILIDQQEHIHLSKVLRKTVGDEVFVCNGEGLLLRAEILSSSKKGTVLLSKEIVTQKKQSDHQLTIAIAPTKNMDRLEWMLEKCIEIGIQGLIPFYAQNSERRRLKLERLEARSVAAMKQSKALFLPKINEAISFKELLETKWDHTAKYIAYVEETGNDIKSVFPTLKSSEKVLVLIGPEGGFSPEEVAMAVKSGFKPISLGQQRLRTETAGVFVASAYQVLCK